MHIHVSPTSPDEVTAEFPAHERDSDLEGSDVEQHRVQTWSSSHHPPHRRSWWIFVAIGALLLTIGAGVIALFPKAPEKKPIAGVDIVVVTNTTAQPTVPPSIDRIPNSATTQTTPIPAVSSIVVPVIQPKVVADAALTKPNDAGQNDAKSDALPNDEETVFQRH
jgi:hypothetical protein